MPIQARDTTDVSLAVRLEVSALLAAACISICTADEKSADKKSKII